MKAYYQMTEPGFNPRTSILGIFGTSYGLQLGEINNFLCIVIYRGKNVVNFKKFEDLKTFKIKDANLITGWVILSLSPIFIDSYQVSRTVAALINQLNQNIRS